MHGRGSEALFSTSTCIARTHGLRAEHEKDHGPIMETSFRHPPAAITTTIARMMSIRLNGGSFSGRRLKSDGRILRR